VSGHLAWSTHESEFLNDLLPLPFDEEALRLVAAHIDEVQDALGRSYLIENPSSYVGFAGSTMTEVEFLGELVTRTGCRLLCDVSNIYLSAHNMGYDARQYLDQLPAGAIGEFHLGGFTPEEDEAQEIVLVDTHAAAIAQPAWDLYAYAVERIGLRPTLIEWDNDIPELATLVAQAARADEIVSNVFAQRHQLLGSVLPQLAETQRSSVALSSSTIPLLSCPSLSAAVIQRRGLPSINAITKKALSTRC